MDSLIGIWKGTYNYHRLTTGETEPITFYMEITTIQGNKFFGHIEEDIETGGLEGLGKIEGIVEDGEIVFTKKMPRYYARGIDGKPVTLQESEQPKLSFKGKFHAQIDKFLGDWGHNFFLKFSSWKPQLVLPEQGIWTLAKLT